MISRNNKLMFKFIAASFVISALAVVLGFFGTHMIMSSQEKRVESHFIPEALRTIELIHRKTKMPIPEIISEYNDFSRFRGPGPRGRPPMSVTAVTKENSSYAFDYPEEIGTYKEVTGKITEPKMHQDQIYNYDGKNFLVFRFELPGPPPGKGRGGVPPRFMLPLILTFVIILFVITVSSMLVLYFLKRKSKKASEVLLALKTGNLKARFPITKIDEASELMLGFNQMADEIEKLVGDLRDTDSMRRKLLQELAHDLRTPVASMKSLLESLLYQGERMTKDQREENLQLSIKEVDYFHHLVEDLLFLSGVHDIRYRGNFCAVDTCDVIQHEVQIINETSKIKVNFSCDDFYFVRADQHLFQRLMKNALTNAITNAFKTVSVKVSREDQFIVIDICNDGHELSADDIISFGKKRATRRISENTEGRISVGLGAVIMAKICEINSAQMSIKNNGSDGKSGATLTLKFNIIEV